MKLSISAQRRQYSPRTAADAESFFFCLPAAFSSSFSRISFFARKELISAAAESIFPFFSSSSSIFAFIPEIFSSSMGMVPRLPFFRSRCHAARRASAAEGETSSSPEPAAEAMRASSSALFLTAGASAEQNAVFANTSQLTPKSSSPALEPLSPVTGSWVSDQTAEKSRMGAPRSELRVRTMSRPSFESTRQPFMGRPLHG